MKQAALLIFLLLARLFTPASFSQEVPSKHVDSESTDEMFTIDTPLTIDLKEEEEEIVEPKKKRRKKNVFYDLKTKKRFVKKGFGDRQVYEIFHVLKEYQTPELYVRDIHWVDYRRGEIRITEAAKVDKQHGAILHGPYKKVKGEQVLEEGIFYKGVKHGRWIKRDDNDILLDKEKYYKGWPKESLVSYYDREHTNIREITPIEYQEKEGNYFYFYETGKVALKGEYHWNYRVGDWVEYYESGRRKKIVRYTKDPHDNDFRPFILKEWDAKGKITYEHK